MENANTPAIKFSSFPNLYEAEIINKTINAFLKTSTGFPVR